MNNNTKIKLWNTKVAINWSIIFSPIFGALIVANNWKKLDQLDEVKKAMKWVYGTLIFFVIYGLVTQIGYQLVLEAHSDLTGKVFNWRAVKEIMILIKLCFFFLYVIFLIAWSRLSAFKQINYIKEKNIIFDKKGWGMPILMAIGGTIIWNIASFIFGLICSFIF